MPRLLKRVAAASVRMACRLVASVWDDAPARASLGRVHRLMRDAAEENYGRVVRGRYSLANARWGADTILSGDGAIIVGRDTYFGERCHVVSHPASATIRIGTGCAISHNVQLRTEGYRTDVPLAEARRLEGEWADITIEDDVWIGANVFVTSGVTIGRNAIIGANSVVTRDVPSGAIAAGVPARVIRARQAERSNGGGMG